MRIEFLDPADTEFVEAITYYNLQSEGLGYEFAAEIKRAMERIMQFPNAWAPLSKRTRRCRTNRFPYGLIYQIRSKTITRRPAATTKEAAGRVESAGYK